MRMKNILLLFSLFVFSSCVMYYNTKDLRGDLEQNLEQYDSNFKRIESDHSKKTEVYLSLKEQIVDVSTEPFASIMDKKSALDQSYKELKERESSLKKYKADFEALAKGKEQFRSNEEEWDKWSLIKKNFKNSASDIGSLGDEYSRRSNILAEALSDGSFKTIDLEKFNSTIEGNVIRLRDYTMKMNEHIKTSKEELKNSYETREINEGVYQAKSKIIEEMESILLRLKSSLKTIYMTKMSLNSSNTKNSKIWVGNNTRSNELMQRMEELIREIESVDKKLVNLSKQLNEP